MTARNIGIILAAWWMPSAAVPTTAVLPHRGAPSPVASDRNEIIGPERRRAT
jgi:hypothetical protein